MIDEKTKKRTFTYNPNKRHSMQPSAAQQGANRVLGKFASKVADQTKQGFNALPATRIAKAGVEKFGEAKEAVAADMQRTSNFAGRATASQDEMPASGRFFKAAQAKQGPEKAESVPNMLPKMQRADPQAALEKTQGITTPLERRMFGPSQQDHVTVTVPGLQRPQPADGNVPSVAEENLQSTGRGIVATDPGVSSARRFGPGTGWIRNEETGDVFAIGQGSNKIVGMNRLGEEISEPTRGFGPHPELSESSPQRTFRADGKYTMGSGLQVEFDPSTSQQERMVFMRQPGRPGTRMRSDLASPGEESPRERYFKANAKYRQPMRRDDNSALIADLRDKAMNSPIASERANAADALIRLQGKQIDASTDIATTGMKETGANTRQFSKNAVDREGNVLDYRVDLEGNRINQQNADSAEALRNAQAGSYTAETEQKQRLSALQQQYLQEIDPQKKAQLEQEIMTLQGRQPGVPRGGLTEKQKIDAKVKLNEEYRNMADNSLDPRNFMTSEDSGVPPKPISKDLMLYRDYPDIARQLYGEPSPETQILLRINQSPERWNYFISLPPEEQQERVKRLVEERKRATA